MKTKFWSTIFVTIVVIVVGTLFAVKFQHRDHGFAPKLDISSQGLVQDEKRYEHDVAELHDYWNHIHAGTDHLESGEFGMAKNEARIAIEKSRSRGDVWVARSLLKRIYQAEGNTDLVLSEIDWMLQNNRRPDVISKLLKEREKLLAAKSQSLQNQASQN